MRGYGALSVSIISEVSGTTMLKFSKGFTNIYPSIGVVISFTIAFYCLSVCLRTVPLSLAYAIWSGVGTALTALIGIIIWHDSFSMVTLLGLVLVIGGVILLNGSRDEKSEIQALKS